MQPVLEFLGIVGHWPGHADWVETGVASERGAFLLKFVGDAPEFGVEVDEPGESGVFEASVGCTFLHSQRGSVV